MICNSVAFQNWFGGVVVSDESLSVLSVGGTLGTSHELPFTLELGLIRKSGGIVLIWVLGCLFGDYSSTACHVC